MQEEYTFSRYYQNSQASTISEQTTQQSQLQCSPEFNILKSKQSSFHINEVKKSREKIFEANRERVLIQHFQTPKITKEEEEESTWQINFLMSQINLGNNEGLKIIVNQYTQNFQIIQRQDNSPSYFEKVLEDNQRQEEEEKKYYEELYYQNQLFKNIEEFLQEDQ